MSVLAREKFERCQAEHAGRYTHHGGAQAIDRLQLDRERLRRDELRSFVGNADLKIRRSHDHTRQDLASLNLAVAERDRCPILVHDLAGKAGRTASLAISGLAIGTERDSG